jgi:co-chaperonin GroES (HSP10)
MVRIIRLRRKYLSYKALNNNLIIELVEEEKEEVEKINVDTQHGNLTYGVKKAAPGSKIVLVDNGEPQVGKRVLSIGKVISAGRGIVSGGVAVPLQCSEGDTIYFFKDMAIPLSIEEGRNLLLLKEESVMALVG